jgi:hypothetical protein
MKIPDFARVFSLIELAGIRAPSSFLADGFRYGYSAPQEHEWNRSLEFDVTPQ